MPSIDKKKIGLLIWFKFINKKILKLIYLIKKRKRKRKALGEGVARKLPPKVAHLWGGRAAPQVAGWS
jgi:hypothetical protein